MNNIENNCVVKILPIVDGKGEPQCLIPVDRIWIDSSKKFIYEVAGGDYILRKLGGIVNKSYLVNILEDGKIKTVRIGKTLMNLIVENKTLLFSLNSDYHIDVVVEEVFSVAIHDRTYPCFDKSSVILKSDWVVPVSDVNSTEEWSAWIKANQDNNYLRHIESNSPLNHRELLDNLFKGNLSKIIASNRDKKISLIV